jgi:hypothetical protein
MYCKHFCLVGGLLLTFRLLMVAPENASAQDAAATPDHYYIGKNGDAFQYEKPPQDRVDAQDFVLVWYRGKTNNKEPLVDYRVGNSSGTLRCIDDCQFVQGTTLVDKRVVHTGRIRITNDPLIYAIMHDARLGKLSIARTRPFNLDGSK